MSSTIASLSELQSGENFSRIIAHASSSESLDEASLSAIWATLSLLHAPTSSQLGFLPAPLTLVASQRPSSTGTVPCSEAQNFLNDLTRAAHDAAVAMACSSVLAGLSSESDEYGDVGFWLGDVSFEGSREEQIVRLLGLDHWLQSGGRIVPTETSSHALPAGLAQLPPLERGDAVQGSLDGLASLTTRLKQRSEFRLEGVGQGGRVIWFLVGRLECDGEQAWVGLIGAGIWAEGGG